MINLLFPAPPTALSPNFGFSPQNSPDLSPALARQQLQNIWNSCEKKLICATHEPNIWMKHLPNIWVKHLYNSWIEHLGETSVLTSVSDICTNIWISICTRAGSSIWNQWIKPLYNSWTEQLDEPSGLQLDLTSVWNIWINISTTAGTTIWDNSWMEHLDEHLEQQLMEHLHSIWI